MTRYHVVHRTEYRYGAPISAGHTIAHLTPRDTPGQRTVAHTITWSPQPDDVEHHTDVFGNTTTYFAIAKAHDRLVVTADSQVEVLAPPAPSGPTPPWEVVVEQLGTTTEGDVLDARRYRCASPLVPLNAELREFAASCFAPGAPVADCVAALNHQIFSQFTFDADFSDVSTPMAEVLRAKRGVCQDFAHLLIAGVRSYGLAARYVSGYIETEPPPGKPKLIGADASHAWCSVFIPGSGWLDVDPTNDKVAPDRHVTVGWGRDYSDIAPLRGVVFGPPSTQSLEVSVDVRRVG
jgi:transglutaminase-like putative cysteine protease